jgi:hypothetical protein
MQNQARNKAIAGGVTALTLAIGGYYWFSKPIEEPAPPPPAPAAVVEEAEHHPVPEATEPKMALPDLAESDPTLIEAFTGLFTARGIEQFLVPQDIVRHLVVSIDNLPRKKVAERLKPIKPIAGQFVVAGTDDARVLSEDNYARYQPFVQMVNAADMNKVASVYFKLYPLFQEAYVDLGYPSAYFNDRLVQVIDHLLATPDVTGPIKLTQPSVMYEFADPKLENLSAGQKALIRMGKANAAVIKTKLRELRVAVANKKPA